MGVFYNFTAGMDFDRKLTLRSMLKKFDFLRDLFLSFFQFKRKSHVSDNRIRQKPDF